MRQSNSSQNGGSCGHIDEGTDNTVESTFIGVGSGSFFGLVILQQHFIFVPGWWCRKIAKHGKLCSNITISNIWKCMWLLIGSLSSLIKNIKKESKKKLSKK